MYTEFSNKCQGSQAKISINNNNWTLNIRPDNDRDFKDSKYTTYTGKYYIFFRDTTVKTVDDVLKLEMETDYNKINKLKNKNHEKNRKLLTIIQRVL